MSTRLGPWRPLDGRYQPCDELQAVDGRRWCPAADGWLTSRFGIVKRSLGSRTSGTPSNRTMVVLDEPLDAGYNV